MFSSVVFLTMANYIFFFYLSCFLMSMGTINEALPVDSNIDTGRDPNNANLTLPSSNVTEVLAGIANLEQHNPYLDASQLARDLIAQCDMLNISYDVLDPTSPNFVPERDRRILDILTDGVRVAACLKNGIQEAICPNTTKFMQCYNQLMQPLPGYGGLGCWTQCEVIPCSEVGRDELAQEEAKVNDPVFNGQLAHEEAVDLAIIYLINNRTEPVGDHGNAANETVVENLL